jgi:O-antigen ligase
MFYFLPSIIFISVGWFTYDPVSIFSSSLLLVISVLMLLFQKQFYFDKSMFLVIPILIPTTYFISSIINNQQFFSAISGGYQRNFGIATMLALSILFFFGVATQINLRQFINYGLISVLVLANIYGYLQIIGLDPLPWTGLHNGIILTLGNPNFAGALYGMLSCVVFIKILQNKKNNFKLAYIGLLISTIFLGFQTYSIQSQLLTFLGCLIAANILYRNDTRKISKKLRLLSMSGILTSITFIVLLFTTNLLPNLRTQIFNQSSIPQRLDYWRTGLEIFMDNPIIGVGADGYQRYAALYRNANQVVRDGYMVIPDRSHNVLIDHFANGGLLIGLMWTILVLSVFYALIKINSNISQNQNYEVAILGAVWSTYIAQSLISPDQILLSIIGYSTGGIIVGLYLKNRRYGSSAEVKIFSSPFFVRVVLSFVLIIVIASTIGSLKYDSQVKQILNKEINQREITIDLINSRFASAKTVELIGVSLIRENSDCVLIDKISNRLLQIDGRSSQAWFMKAICENKQKSFQNAQNFIGNSLKFDPLNVNYLLGKAEIEFIQNKKIEAKITLDTIRRINPLEPEILRLEALIK